MKINIDKFCSLSASPAWQAWLFHFNAGLYRKFIQNLRGSKGCDQNREIMVDLVKEIETIDGGVDQLFGFLRKQYPHMLIDDKPVKLSVKPDKIFPDYNPHILTYPRRMIFEGVDAERLAREFLNDKFQSDLMVIDGVVYVEYLTSSDSHLKDRVPLKNWLIATWRLSSTK